MKNTTNFPQGWDAERVERLVRHYELLSEDEAVAEDEAAFEDNTHIGRDPEGIGACPPSADRRMR